MPGQVVTVSLDNFVKRGLFEKGNIEVVSAKWDTFDYQGKAQPSTCLTLGLRRLEDPPDAEPFIQHWGVGGGTSRFVPNPADNGNTLVAVGDDTALSEGSNLHYLLNSMDVCGAPKTILSSAAGAAGIVGLQGEMESRAIKRTGMKNQDGTDKESNNVLIFNSITKLPGGVKVAGAKQTTTATAQPQTQSASNGGTATTAGGSDEYLSIMGGKILAILGESGPLAFAQVQAKLLNGGLSEIPTSSRAKLVIDNIRNTAFLNQYGVELAGTTLKLMGT